MSATTWGSLVALLSLTTLAAGGVVVVGTIALRWLRQRCAPLAVQSALVAAVSVTSCLGGIAAVSAGMMVTGHDVAVVFATLPVSGVIALAYGWRSARRITADLEALVDLDRDPGSADVGAAVASTGRRAPGTREVAAVAHRLEVAAEQVTAARAREQLLEANRRELVAAVSHDLRTPLTSMRVIAEAFSDDLVRGPQMRSAYLTSLLANIARMSDLVDALFELSQLDAGLVTLRSEPVNLDQIVLDLLVRFEPHADAKGVGLQAGLESQNQVTLGDPQRLQRILSNLVDNAIRHTPAGGSVSVTLDPAEAGSIVRVQDGCGGIPEADLPRVFDRLWRGDQSRSSAGAGLGLTIAAAFADLHGGRLTASNRPSGCEFSLELPSPGGSLRLAG